MISGVAEGPDGESDGNVLFGVMLAVNFNI